LEINVSIPNSVIEGLIDDVLDSKDWQESVLDRTGTPPGSPAEGARYLITTGTDAWSGHDDEITEYRDGAWVFISPDEGTRVHVDDEDKDYNYNGAAWAEWSAGGLHGSTHLFGAADDIGIYTDGSGAPAGTGTDGTFYVDTDTDTLYYSDGAAWTALATGGISDLDDVPDGSSYQRVAATEVDASGYVTQLNDGTNTIAANANRTDTGHDHDGTDSKYVAHSDTSGQGADDHHNEDHASRHAAAGGDPLDGDGIECGYAAVNYTPAASTIAGHFEGIDDELTGGGLTQEEVEDYVGAMVGGGSVQTDITVSYDDINGELDFVVSVPHANTSGQTEDDHHNRSHALDSASDHSGTLPESDVAFDNATGHTHDGVDSTQADHADLANIGTNAHSAIDTHIADAGKHREINDSGSASTDLWSADKITTVAGTKASTDHDATHERAGSDEIDGDHLDIDFTPSNYTPSTSPAEAANVDDLAAHLAGIDDALGSAGGGGVTAAMAFFL